MKVFLDTNIILDLLLEREGFENSIELFTLQEEDKLRLCTSILSMANIAYVYRKMVGAHMVAPNLNHLKAIIEVLPMNADMLQEAIFAQGKDFEDNLQLSCATNACCEWFITRNIKDFPSSSKSITICTPLEFVGRGF